MEPPADTTEGNPPRDPKTALLLVSVLLIATCGLVYELITATMASYLLGDSVTQFSLVIGVYLSAMGLGSWLSKKIETRLYDRFIRVQLVIALVGGFSAPALYLAFGQLASVRPLLFGILIVVGCMVGLEIPLVMRVLQKAQSFKDLVARVLAFDYLGALAASVLFPLVLLPHLGLIRTSLLFGLINAGVALWTSVAFAPRLRRPLWIRGEASVVAAALAVTFVFGGQLEATGERQLFDAPVVMSTKTPYQRLTLTRWRDDVRLYIDGNLQFSSLDEHRYHEALVHPAMADGPTRGRVLLLGGGDGLALREVLAHPGVQSVDLVDLDPAMTELFSTHPMLRDMNRDAFEDPRVAVHNADAMHWLEGHEGPPFDVILIDLPDPNNFSLGKLYTRSFYRLVARHLATRGTLAVQATSPYLAPQSFWCIAKTMQAAGLEIRPYHAHVPSFGDWGFVLATASPRPIPTSLVRGVARRFLDASTLPGLFAFPLDLRPPPVEINRLNDQLLVHYYERDLQRMGPGPGQASGVAP